MVEEARVRDAFVIATEEHKVLRRRLRLDARRAARGLDESKDSSDSTDHRDLDREICGVVPVPPKMRLRVRQLHSALAQSTFWYKADGRGFDLEDSMARWLRRIRGTLGMGLTWAFAWAVGGILIGVASKVMPFLPWWDAFFRVFDAPLPAFAVPGFFAGVFFSTVVGVLGRRSKLHELSVSRMAAWGAAAGAMLTAFPFVLVGVGLASRSGSSVGTGQIIAVITAPFILFSAASAAMTLKIARLSRQKDSAAAVDDLPDALADSGVRELPEGNPSLGEQRTAQRTAQGSAQPEARAPR